MSGELKSENINTEKAPTQRSHDLAKRSTIVPIHTTNSKKDIITLYSTILQNTRKTLKTNNQDPPQSMKTLTDCCSYLNAILIDNLEHSLR
jgi:hypothetical protein